MTPAQIVAARPLFKVTIAYFCLYYFFCFFQGLSKFYLYLSRRRCLAVRARRVASVAA